MWLAMNQPAGVAAGHDGADWPRYRLLPAAIRGQVTTSALEVPDVALVRRRCGEVPVQQVGHVLVGRFWNRRSHSAPALQPRIRSSRITGATRSWLTHSTRLALSFSSTVKRGARNVLPSWWTARIRLASAAPRWPELHAPGPRPSTREGSSARRR